MTFASIYMKELDKSFFTAGNNNL